MINSLAAGKFPLYIKRRRDAGIPPMRASTNLSAKISGRSSRYLNFTGPGLSRPSSSLFPSPSSSFLFSLAREETPPTGSFNQLRLVVVFGC